MQKETLQFKKNHLQICKKSAVRTEHPTKLEKISIRERKTNKTVEVKQENYSVIQNKTNKNK